MFCFFFRIVFAPPSCSFFLIQLISDDDVVNWYVDEFYEEANESHDAESDGGGDCNLLELTAIGLGASFD